MKNLGLLIAALFSLSISYAQVGIGNPSPNPGSILDLTNANDKALLLPQTLTPPSSILTFNTEGMLIYHQGNLHLKLASGVKVITPWNYDGTAANGLWAPTGTNVGIGRQPLASSGALLTIGPASGDANLTTSRGSIVLGDNNFDSTHMLLDRDEILVKTNATTGGILNLQQEGGTVEVRNGATRTTSTVVTVNGSIDASKYGRIREHGFDLLPVGSVIMWYGTVNAAGYPLVGGVADSTWHVCDGGTYTKMDGSGTAVTPDLRERFIVGAGLTDNAAITGTTQYAVGAGGDGNNFITLNASQMPVHNHTMNAAGGHNHSISNFIADGLDHDASGGGGEQYWRANSGGSTNTGAVLDHNHTINDAGGTAGVTQSHENRPPYYALYFLMKL